MEKKVASTMEVWFQAFGLRVLKGDLGNGEQEEHCYRFGLRVYGLGFEVSEV